MEIRPINNNNVQFKGNIIKTIIMRNEVRSRAESILAFDKKAVKSMTRYAGMQRMGFLDSLIDVYNVRYFEGKALQKDGTDVVKNIYKMVKNPKYGHYYILRNIKESMQNLERIFAGVDNKKSRLNLVESLNKDVYNELKTADKSMIVDVLESKNVKKYAKNYKKYKAYFILNKDDKDAVKKLDEMVESKTFDPKEYNEKLAFIERTKTFWFPETEVLNKKVFNHNYSEEGSIMMSKIYKYMPPTKDMMEAGCDKDLLEILKTTNEDNLYERLSILRSFYYQAGIYKPENRVEDVNCLKNVYEKIDEDKNARKFIEKSIHNITYSVKTLKELDNILRCCSTKDLNIFHKNALRIIRTTAPEERLQALKDGIRDPFSETPSARKQRKRNIYYGYAREYSSLFKFAKNIQYGFKALKSKLTRGTNVIEDIAFVQPEVKEAVVSSKPSVQEALKIDEVAAAKAAKKAAKAEQKKFVQDSILDIANGKLGAKTFERQKDSYKTNATKIRLALLPEIFASITDTRNADRMVGKARINSSNKDALALFLKINGSNRKFVNYLLKKQNVDGSRMFEVKDIIGIVDRAEKKIAADKKANPLYRANDARKYYNHLYEAKIQQYGKLPKKPINTKA